MVPVCNVVKGNVVKRAFNPLDRRRAAQRPGSMANPVQSRKINVGRLRGFSGCQLLHGGGGAVNKKDRSRLGIKGLNVADPVIFLVRSGQFVFLDGMVQYLATGSGDQADLRVAPMI